ncbi:MAG TPA: ATP-dependent zinc metalloprotease FtsH [Albitalea sp.]|nr:ATP-dependent zinc metalloprotease FtsH [Albitalea sp.]
MDKKHGLNLGYLVFALLAMMVLRDWWAESRSIETLPYSTFEAYLREGKIAEVRVGDKFIVGKLKSPQSDGKTSVVAAMVEPAVAERLATFGVPYTRVQESTWLRDVLSWVAPMLLFFGIWFFLVRRFGEKLGAGGLMSLGQSKAKVYMERQTGVRFDDVAGVDEAKAELQEIVEFLKDPKEHGRLGARVPKGVLLMGPTGTGKTLLARAVAGEAGVAFFSISGSEFIEMFVGVGAARVRDLFEQARANAPAIIFIDELDALGKARGPAFLAGGHDEREQTLNQLLVELDGFDPSVGVVLLAATNRPEVLDPALLRAGRFDRQVLVDRPDRAGRTAILRVHAKKVRLAADVDLDQVAAITVGFAGADLANLVNEAALVATRRRAEDVTLSDFTQAIERIVAGIEKKHGLLSLQERQTVAYHEMGHALAALALPGADKVHKVSIVPHGIGALGYTLQRPTEDRHLMRRGELMNKLTVLLGGRAAEQLVFGELSTGAADDIAKATDLARDMVMRYGMDPALGAVSYADDRPSFLAPQDMGTPASGRFSPQTAQHIDAAVRGVIDEALERATALLRQNRAVLERCAKALLERETLEEKDIAALTADLSAPGPAGDDGASALLSTPD